MSSRLILFIAALVAISHNLTQALPLTQYLDLNHNIAKRSTKQDDYIVQNLPGLDQIPEDKKPIMHAGYLNFTTTSEYEYFFWKFSKQQNRTAKNTSPDSTTSSSNDANKKLIFWFNGGPGCSSLDGALIETGPLTVNENEQVEYRQGAWLEVGDVVYVDQPIGVGYNPDGSDKSYPTEMRDVATDLVAFLQEYFRLFPDDKTKEMYLTGESYGGQYIPYFAAKILANHTDYNLKGLLIINGYIYPDVQNSEDIAFALENKVIDASVAESDETKQKVESCIETYESNQKSWAKITKEMQENGEYSGNNNDSGTEDNKVGSTECELLLNTVLYNSLDKSKPSDQQCVNVYDFTLRDAYPDCGSGNFPSNQKQVSNFLNDKKVNDDLNLHRTKSWSECSNSVSANLANQYSYPAFFKLPYILKQIPVMLVVGKNDIICNIKGLEKTVSILNWGDNKNSTGFSDSVKAQNYTVDGTVYGEVKYEDNLWFVGVNNASHMVPYSQPIGGRGPLDIFLGNYKQENGQYVAQSHGDY